MKQIFQDREPLLNQSEAAEFLGLTGRCLERWRLIGGGPAFVKISPRCVRYQQRDLQSWLDARRVVGRAA